MARRFGKQLVRFRVCRSISRPGRLAIPQPLRRSRRCIQRREDRHEQAELNRDKREKGRPPHRRCNANALAADEKGRPVLPCCGASVSHGACFRAVRGGTPLASPPAGGDAARRRRPNGAMAFYRTGRAATPGRTAPLPAGRGSGVGFRHLQGGRSRRSVWVFRGETFTQRRCGGRPFSAARQPCGRLQSNPGKRDPAT